MKQKFSLTNNQVGIEINDQQNNQDQSKNDNNKEEEQKEEEEELRVCDVIGDWGQYQFNIAILETVTAALMALTVLAGPIWTPDMKHFCISDGLSSTSTSSEEHKQFFNNFSLVQQCSLPNQTHECVSFIYDDENYGKVLTNSFDLVCGRKWLRSFLSSSALTGILLSSVTLGLLSDRFGRISCIKTGLTISILATTAAILVTNFLLLNVCFMLMAYALVGVTNALSTLVMESTSPRWRFVPVCNYQFGWASGILLVPLLNNLTMNYQLYLCALLLAQVLVLVWVKFRVFESIRWLLCEGYLNRAQIELQRACRINNLRQCTQLAQKIAQIQAQQIQKATKPREEEKLTHLDLNEPSNCEAKELATIKRSSFHSNAGSCISMEPEVDINQQENSSSLKKSHSIKSHCSASSSSASSPGLKPLTRTTSRQSLSPTLARKLFSLSCPEENSQQQQPPDVESNNDASNNEPKSLSLDKITTNQVPTRIERHQEGKSEENGFFLFRMFHRKLYKLTILLVLIDTMLETSYYGLIEANKFVGSSVDQNYIVGALFEWVACVAFIVILSSFSRQLALIIPTLTGALVCLALATNYHLIPGSALGIDNLEFLQDHENHQHNQNNENYDSDLLLLRENMNFWLIPVGKLALAISVLVVMTISMESYPNNLRQTAPASIVVVGRIGSIIAPFLFNDPSGEKLLLKGSLLTLGTVGIVTCALVPFVLRNTKNSELCDHLNDIK